MAFQAVPNGAEFVVRGVMAGQEIINTFYGTHAGAWGQAELDAATDAVATVWSTYMLPNLGNTYTFVGVHGRDLRTLNGGFESDSFIGAGAGGVTGGTLPNNVAISVKRSSGLVGRSTRGRVYIGGIPNSAWNEPGNTITTALASLIVTALDHIKSSMDDVDWTEVIVSRTQAGATLPVAVVYTVLEYTIVNLVLDSVRRRLPGRGE